LRQLAERIEPCTSGSGKDDAGLALADERRQVANGMRHRRRVPRVDGFRFSTDVTVRFAETDAQGVAHNANYLIWFEVARVAYLAEYAGGYSAIREQGLESFVLETHVRYLQPAKFDDQLVVHARCVDVRGARFRYEYAIQRDRELLADGWTAHATVDAATFRPTRVPGWLIDAIASAERSVQSPSAS